MFSCVLSGAVHGMQSYLLRIETDISDGLPTFSMVGFVSAQVREAQERVRVAMKNSGINLPPKRITVNFTPAEIPKRDLIADLPIAVGLLEAMEVLKPDAADGLLVLGGLSLDGVVTPIRGVLPMVREAAAEGIHTVLLPKQNVKEAAALGKITAIGVETLEEVIHYLKLPQEERSSPSSQETMDFLARLSIHGCDGETDWDRGDGIVDSVWKGARGQETEQGQAERKTTESKESKSKTAGCREQADFKDICGQDGVKRALEIAAAGFHNVLMIGPPGSGKSMMAKCLPGILPPLTREECLEVSAIYSVAGELPPEDPLIHMRPFMAPHHSITQQALVGGGVCPKPGVISLAHRGVLFLDELPEFGRENLNLLRQPLEDQHIVISRNSGNYDFPTRFMLIAAANPCPCGYYPGNQCNCTMPEIIRYQNRMPGPILDRIDITVDAPKVPVDYLLNRKTAESSEKIRERVMEAQERQRIRFRDESISFNGEMSTPQAEKYCVLARSEKKFVKEIFQKMNLSARAFHRILKVARTIADLDGAENITEDHLAEAVGYRCTDRGKPGTEGIASGTRSTGRQERKME